MTCRAEDVATYADGQLPAAERLAFESHLSGCQGCRKALRLARALKGAVRAVAAPSMPPDLLASLRAEAARRRPASLWRRTFSALWERRPAAYGMAAGFAAAALLVVVRLSRPAAVTVSVDDLVAAHGDYARAMPLAPEDRILADLPRQLESVQ